MKRAVGPDWELRLGAWQDVLKDVAADHMLTDPMYSERTHQGTKFRDERSELARTAIAYDAMSPRGAGALVRSWRGRVRGWMCIMTDHVLVPAYERAFEAKHKHDVDDRVTFAPLPIVQPGSGVRMQGDGPSSWTVWLMVSRPKGLTRELGENWGTLPGWYDGSPYDADRPKSERDLVKGSKPLWLMRALVRDYTEPGDLIVDPFAGSGTTLLAAVIERRRAVGAEVNRETYEAAVQRLQKGFTPDMFGGEK